MSPRISLIATFYNAEDYLDRCVRSLIAQAHGDYEIILIDDGSTDETFARLSRYSHGEFVRCYTKDNGGAGSARNFGISKARGEYISFVDGDDFISPYYLEALDFALKESGCVMATATPVVVRTSSAQSISWEYSFSPRRVSSEDAILMLAHEEVTESPCSKLAPRALYEELPFPERWYEDVAIAGAHFLAVGDIAVIDVPVYAYVMTPGSVVNRKRASISQLEDFMAAIDDFIDPLEREYPQFAAAFAYRRALEYARAHSLAIHVVDDVDNARRIDAELIRLLAYCLSSARRDASAPRLQLARFTMLSRAPKAYDLLFGVYNRLAKLS